MTHATYLSCPPDMAVSTLSKYGRALVVAVIGPPGCGKTSLIEATLRRLRGRLRIAVITVNPAAQRDAKRLHCCCDYVAAVQTAFPGGSVILSALDKLDMNQIDLLLIESMGGIAGPPNFQQDHTVCVLALSDGDDKAAEYSQLLERSSAVILTKGDLEGHVTFNHDAFAADVARINPLAELIEVSVVDNMGMAQWLAWIESQLDKKHAGLPLYDPEPGEWFAG